MPKLLIAEDNRMFREILKETIVSSFPSMKILECEDGRDVIQKVKEHIPDLIFMDIGLRHENGLVLTKKIKSLYAHIPVIIITWYDSAEYRVKADDAGADFFFSKKDIKPGDIISMVNSLLYEGK